MIKPFLEDDEFLADVADAKADRPSPAHSAEHTLNLWWLGQSGFLVRAHNRFLLIDPYLSDSLTKKYARTDKPHVRVSERVIDPARLDFIHLVTASHAHTDHLDPETLQPLMRVNPDLRLIAPEAIRALAAERAGVPESRVTPMTWTSHEHLAGFDVTAVPAAHEKRVLNPAGRDDTFLGYVFRCGNFTLYHSGDTVPCEEAVQYVRPMNVDVALLPINGRKPERRVDGNLWGAEAAQLAKKIGAKLVIPCHYDLFEFNTADPQEQFVPECRRLGQPCRVLQLGQRFTSTEVPR